MAQKPTRASHRNQGDLVNIMLTGGGVKQPHVIPPHVAAIITEIQKRAKEISLKVGVDKAAQEASRITVSDPGAKPYLEVVVSHILDKETLTAVVFRTTTKPLGLDSVTRHYQPEAVLGKDHLGNSNSAIFSTDITRRPLEWVGLDVVAFLTTGDPGKQYKAERSF